MTSNQVANKQAEIAQQQAEIAGARQREEKRHNRQNERLEKEKRFNERRGQDTQYRGTIASGVFGLAGKAMGNDPSWYNKDKQLVDDVARIPFGVPLGVPVDGNGLGQEVIPGVMRLNWVPTIGSPGLKEPDEKEYQAINVAARNLYAYVRHANSGARNYEAMDMMMYVLALDSAYTLVSHCMRGYSIALTAKQENRYYNATAMLQAAGFSSNILQTLAQFRYEINRFVQQLNAFALPKVFSYIERHIWMGSTIFKDDPIKKSQEYLFVPKGYWVWGSDTATGTKLTWKSLYGTSPSGGLSLTDVRTAFNNIITALITDEDAGIISGDILKAYTEAELYFIQEIPDDFHIESQWSPEVLTQIGSSVVVPVNEVDLSIWQNTDLNMLYQGSGNDPADAGIKGVWKMAYAPAFTPAAFTPGERAFLNVQKDSPSADEVMVSSRLVTLIKLDAVGSGTDMVFDVTCCGTEILTDMIVYKLANGGGAAPTVISNGSLQSIDSTVASSGQTVLNLLALLSKFDWQPIFRVYLTDAGAALRYVGTFNDIQNYAAVGIDELEGMNQTAILSQFGVPYLGTKIRSNSRRS